MPRRSERPIAAFGGVLFIVFSVAAQEPPPPLPPLPAVGISPAEPEPVQRWLDEVRAQRQIGEERRRAAKEAMDARRRWIDPWGAAQKEAREHEAQRRREAFMEKIDRDRETLRSQGPWAVPRQPLPDVTAELPPPGNDTTAVPGQSEPHASTYPLPGWDNRWYYRGF